jgi:hypothetical protein
VIHTKYEKFFHLDLLGFVFDCRPLVVRRAAQSPGAPQIREVSVTERRRAR